MTTQKEALEAWHRLYNEWCLHSYPDRLKNATDMANIRRFIETAAATQFQSRVKPWMDACFGPEISADRIERNHRFLEESLELVQTNGCTRSEAHQLVDYVYNRPEGELHQEIGGVMVTLAALCLASNEDMHECGERELARIWTRVEKIRAKQAAKPKHSPLPEHVLEDSGGTQPISPDTSELVAWLDRELEDREQARQLFIEGIQTYPSGQARAARVAH